MNNLSNLADKIIKAVELKFPFPIKTTRDTGWQYSPLAKPNRGLHDYERFIQFERGLTSEEEKSFEAQMKEKDNPGYCWWKFVRIGIGAYKLSTTLDSSD